MAKGGYAGGVKVLVSPEIEFDMNEFRRKCVKLKNTIRDILKSLEDKDIDITVDADTRRAKQKIEDLKDEANEAATLEVDVDKGAASASLAALTRDRYVEIKAVIDGGAFATAKAALASLSGASALREAGNGMRNLVRHATTLKGLMTGIKASGLVTLGAAATSAVGGVSALVKGMGSLLPLASALPGVAAGIFAGFKGVSTVISDAAERMEGLGYSFQSVNKAIGDNAWPKFGASLRSLADSALPRLEAGMGKVGGAIGAAANDMLTMINTSRNMGAISSVLDNTAAAIGRMGPGLGSLVNAFSGLASVGSTFLPQMADWFNQAADGAARWVAEGMKTGSIANGIQTAVNAAKTLAGAIGDVLGIFGAVGNAAETAGFKLTGIAGALDNVHRWMDSLAGQQTLVNVFNAASAAMDAFQGSAGNVGNTISTLAQSLEGIAVPAATALGEAFRLLSDVLVGMVSGGGVADFFTGIQNAMTSLSPQADNLGTIFSNLASFAGTMASVIGSVLAPAIDALTPVITNLAPMFEQLATTLGVALADAINVIAPVLQTIAEVIAQVGTFLATYIPPEVLTAIAVAVGVVAAAFGVWNAVMALMAMNPVVLLIMAIVAAVVALIAIVNAIIQNWDVLWAKAKEVWEGIWNKIKEVCLNIWEWVVDKFNAVKSFLSNCWNGIKSFASSIWNGIKTTISNAIEWVRNWIQAKVSQISSAWSTAWNNIKSFFTNIWNGIKSFASSAVNAVRTTIQNVVNGIKNFWNNAWNTIKSFFSNAWNTIKSLASTAVHNLKTTISNGINNVVSTVRQLPSKARSALSNIGSTLINAGRNLIQGFINGIKDMFGSVASTLGNLTSKLTSWKGPESLDKRILTPAGKYVIQGFLRGLESQYSAVKRSLQDFTQDLGADMKANVSPRLGIDAYSVGATAGGAVAGSGGMVTVNQYYPVAEDASKVRDAAAMGIRLAGTI